MCPLVTSKVEKIYILVKSFSLQDSVFSECFFSNIVYKWLPTVFALLILIKQNTFDIKETPSRE